MPTRGPKTRLTTSWSASSAAAAAVTSTRVGVDLAHRVEVGREGAHRGGVRELGQHEERRADDAHRCDPDRGLARRVRRPAGSNSATGKSSTIAPSSGRVARSSPLLVWNTASFVASSRPVSHSTCALASVACPQSGDLDLGREPPQVVGAVEAGEHEGGLGVLHLGRDRPHPVVVDARCRGSTRRPGCRGTARTRTRRRRGTGRGTGDADVIAGMIAGDRAARDGFRATR